LIVTLRALAALLLPSSFRGPSCLQCSHDLRPSFGTESALLLHGFGSRSCRCTVLLGPSRMLSRCHLARDSAETNRFPEADFATGLVAGALVGAVDDPFDLAQRALCAAAIGHGLPATWCVCRALRYGKSPPCAREDRGTAASRTILHLQTDVLREFGKRKLQGLWEGFLQKVSRCRKPLDDPCIVIFGRTDTRGNRVCLHFGGIEGNEE